MNTAPPYRIICNKGVVILQEFPIVYHDNNCGIAKVQKDGLYYRISCRCKYSSGLYQIWVTGEQGTVNLGTCVLSGKEIGLDTRIAVKRLATIKTFEMNEKYQEEPKWIPLTPNTPIKLSILGKSYLFQKNGAWGLTVKDE